MSTDEHAPDLSSLSSDYEILGGLPPAESEQSFFARHIALNRDVTITAVRVPEGNNNALTHFASDARSLSVMRHRNIVPVIEGRWLRDGGFAIVRARVRGGTLADRIAAAGPIPVPETASTLEQVYAAIEWARSNGIVHRRVTAESIVFLQGSGRVLVELEASRLAPGALPDVCDDAKTIGLLAHEMLTGRRGEEATAKPLTESRPDLPSRAAKDADALMQCQSEQTARRAVSLIAALGEKPVMAVVQTVSGADDVVPGVLPQRAGALFSQQLSRSTRIAAVMIVAGIIGVLGLVLLSRRIREVENRAAAGTTRTPANAGGEVTSPQSKPGTKPPIPVPPATAPETPTTRKPIAPPPTRRHEPPRGTSPSTMPNPKTKPRDTVSMPPVATAVDSIALQSAPDVCDSPETSDQHRCLSTAIVRNDREMNDVYQRVVAALRRHANVEPTDPDPPSVDALREAQLRWLDARDVACRGAGTGQLYARVRAQCYAEQSTKRRNELVGMLGRVEVRG